jgi:hypothetical protein
MLKKRMNDRIAVDLPVTCSVEHKNKSHQGRGKIRNLSISGMQLELPFPVSHLSTQIVDFVLELPHPFSRIKGAGEIQWKRWNQEKQSTTCGLKLSPMSLPQLQELDTIIAEIHEDEGEPESK